VSLSNPRSQSPVRKYFKVKSGTGDVVTYDKAQRKEIVEPIPFRFIVLDVLNAVAGFHEPSNSGIWSNEFRNSSTDAVRVRTKNGLLIDGTYSDIKDRLKSMGGRFANSVYIAYKEGSETALGNIQFVGASVSAWFDFGKGKSFDSDPGVALTGFSEEKKGRTEYFVPVFDRFDVPEAALQQAAKLDRDLQQYLDSSLKRTESEPVNEPQQSPWDSPAPAFSGTTSFGGGGNFDAEPPF
jgi:hypothetical protein